VPRSAVINAVPLLDEYGVRATFYVALGLSRSGGAFAGEEDVRALAEHGHGIGCHTLSHYSLRRGTPQGLRDDALAGRRALEEILDGARVEHFSYPYGATGLLHPAFATMRTSVGGINAGRVDLTYLHAENVYSGDHGLDLDRVRRRVRSVARGGGWLILYTHGVYAGARGEDTSCDDLRRALEVVLAAGVDVMAVADAAASIVPPQAQPVA
jgi:peptidoglycan/xylan/chitin deacetylase (PgdA/CDA1 family)